MREWGERPVEVSGRLIWAGWVLVCVLAWVLS